MTRFVDSNLTLREWLPLIGITVSAFIFNTSEFMPVGLLTGIGASFGTSEGVTGLIISVYAWAVMLLSLPLMILGSRLAFRPLMLLVIGVFCAGQALSALAPSYGLLRAARLVVACAQRKLLACNVGNRHCALPVCMRWAVREGYLKVSIHMLCDSYRGYNPISAQWEKGRKRSVHDKVRG